MIIGRLDLHNRIIRKRLLFLGITTTILTELLSEGLTYYFIPYIGKEAATFLFNTGPILPNLLYILSATGSVFSILIICLYITEKFENNWFVTSIVQTGQLTLTHYVSHVFIGIGTLILLNRMEHQTLLFVLLFATAFFIFSILFSVLWRKKFSRGPIEWIMRKLAS
ncbi:hypothetical protein B4082_3246 [Bacillus cereus]|uniref:DUF418 domain-containing protein n=1 Tax=Bacillus cereus TaxID=1396 RepID=A0A164ELQ4_BACCE|nr:hypothetical protein B4082_3246 [Bacillus cereus]